MQLLGGVQQEARPDEQMTLLRVPKMEGIRAVKTEDGDSEVVLLVGGGVGGDQLRRGSDVR